MGPAQGHELVEHEDLMTIAEDLYRYAVYCDALRAGLTLDSGGLF